MNDYDKAIATYEAVAKSLINAGNTAQAMKYITDEAMELVKNCKPAADNVILSQEKIFRYLLKRYKLVKREQR